MSQPKKFGNIFSQASGYKPKIEADSHELSDRELLLSCHQNNTDMKIQISNVNNKIEAIDNRLSKIENMIGELFSVINSIKIALPGTTKKYKD